MWATNMLPSSTAYPELTLIYQTKRLPILGKVWRVVFWSYEICFGGLYFSRNFVVMRKADGGLAAWLYFTV